MTEHGDQAALLAAAAAGRTLTDIANAAGLSKSSVQRRLKDPEIAAQIAAIRSEQRTKSLERMTALRDKALTRLEGMLEHEDPAISMRAVTLALSTTAKNDLVTDLEHRLLALEEATSIGDEPSVDAAAAMAGETDDAVHFAGRN